MKTIHAGVALVALAWAVQARAQQQPPVQAAADLPVVPGPAAATIEQGPGAVQDQAPAPMAAASDESGEIIVTAQRRSERLVDVPATVTVVSADSIALAGQNSLQSLNKLVPGLYINQPVFFLSPTIRGVGSTLSVTNESAVAVYVDGVYQPAQASNVFDLASISDVEVLKGPQGTLFGRNATGGALLVTTLDPSFDREARLNLSYGRFDEVRANGYVNLPIGDSVAANLAISNRYSSGYIRDVRTGEIRNEGRSFLARGKLRVKPSENLDIVLTASRAYQNDPSAANYQSLDGVNRLSATPGSGPLARGRYQVSHSVRDAIRNTADEYTAHVDLTTGLGTLSSITALKRDELRSRTDSDNTYLNAGDVDQVFKQRTFSQEVNITSKPGGDLQYVVGVYYYHNRRFYPQFNVLGFPFLYQDNVNDAISGYADGSYSFGDLTIIAGIRYSTEKRKLDNELFAPLARPSTASVRARDNAWTPRIGLRYALNSSSNIYGTYSRGFKSGAFNGTSAIGAGINPEKIDAFELGYKLSTPQFSLNLASYYYDYKDIQASTLLVVNGIATTVLANAAKARVYGAEVEAIYRLDDALNIRGAFSYTNAKYTSFPNATGYFPRAGGGYTTGVVDASDNPLVRQPKFQASAQINYSVPVGDDKLTFTLSPSYNSRVYFDFASQLSQAPVFVLDGSVDLELESGLSVAVYGRNILDRKYCTFQNFSTNDIIALYEAPATYGVRLSYAFR